MLVLALDSDRCHFLAFWIPVYLRMRFIKLIFLLSLVFTCITRTTISYSQSDYRNSFMLNADIVPTGWGLGYAPAVFYERILVKPFPGKAMPFVRAGYSTFFGANHIFIGQLGIVTNTSKHRLEFSLGACSLVERGKSPEGFLSGNIGYRLHKTGSRWMFRTGIGFPEFLYVGFGYRL